MPNTIQKSIYGRKKWTKRGALSEISHILSNYTPKEPYISNAIWKIKDILENIKEEEKS